MANLIETPEWGEGVLRLDKDTPVLGFDPENPEAGNGPSNAQAQELVNRTAYLRGLVELGDWNMAPVGGTEYTADSAGAVNATVGGTAGAYTVEPVTDAYLVVQANETLTSMGGPMSVVHQDGLGPTVEFFFGACNPEMTAADVLASLGSPVPSLQIALFALSGLGEFVFIKILAGGAEAPIITDTAFPPVIGDRTLFQIVESGSDYILQAWNEGDPHGPWDIGTVPMSEAPTGLKPFVMVNYSGAGFAGPKPVVVSFGGEPGVTVAPADFALDKEYRITGAGTYAGETAAVGDIVKVIGVSPDAIFVSRPAGVLATQADLVAINDALVVVDGRLDTLESQAAATAARALCNGAIHGYVPRGTSAAVWTGGEAAAGWDNQPIGITVLDGNDGSLWTKTNPESDGLTAATLVQWDPKLFETFGTLVEGVLVGNKVSQLITKLAHYTADGVIAAGLPWSNVYLEGNGGVPIPADLGYVAVGGDLGFAANHVSEPANPYAPPRNTAGFTRISWGTAGAYDIDTAYMVPGAYYFQVELPYGSGVQVDGGAAGVFYQDDADTVNNTVMLRVIKTTAGEAFVDRIRSSYRGALGDFGAPVVAGPFDTSVDMDSVSTFSMPRAAKTVTLTGAAGPYTLTVTGLYGNEETPVVVLNSSGASVTLQASGSAVSFSDVLLAPGKEAVFGVIRRKWRLLAH